MSDRFSLGSVEVSLTPLERFEEFLQSKGKRITQPRRALVEHIFARHEHFDADELTAEVSGRDGGPKASRPTVYRTLNELVDAGLLRRFEVDGRSVFEHDYGYPQHDHLHCEKCGELIEFSSEEVINLLKRVGAEMKFRVTSHRLIVHGVCEACQKSRRNRRPHDLI